ncbi:AEC family transporter [Halopenitus salinus]|jgi:predicted permease|uniref:AEC family transporter n=1 Tax=Halopenitus salinus TaxID=1198295 RepID=A0ABD5UPB0_9EURY
MNELVGIFTSAVLPIVAIAGVGFVLGRTKDVDPGSLNTAVVYVLAPALVFHSLALTALSAGTLARIAGGVVLFTLSMVAVGEVIGRALGTEEPLLSALLLVAIFSNSGNLGIPVSDFAFGDVGRQTAVLFLSVQSVLMYTVGVYLASRSGGSSGLSGVKKVFFVPLVYAVVAALLARAADVVPPAGSATMEAVGLVGDSSIPVMLLILGIELSRTDYGGALASTAVPAAMRLALAPLLGLAIVTVLGFENQTVARVFVLETAMPAAITPLILVVEFAGSDTEGITAPELISTSVLVTTIVSVPYLTLVIALLQSGLLI